MMSNRWPTSNQLQSIWAIDSDRWESNLRWQFALRLPEIRYQHISWAAIVESPDQFIEMANRLNRPLVTIIELNRANLVSCCSLLSRFSQELSSVLFMAVGERALEACLPVMQFGGFDDFYSQEADLKRMMKRILLFRSATPTSQTAGIEQDEGAKSITGLANQIKDQLPFIL